MASLTGNTIQSTYDSLLKVTDNDSITGSLKRITDGLGNNTPLYLSNSAVEIVSALNVTGAITGSNLSGTNTGDETKASIETKLGAATSSNSGYLTSTDWSTFNNKIAGTGTLNKLAKFSSSSSIADSTITDTGSAVTIGVATSVTGSLTASSIIKSGGTASQILAADGSVITAGTNITISGGTISSSGGISGSGTTNTIPKFTGSTSLGNSNITDSGTLITAGSNTYINGRLGVGITASSLYGVVVTSPISGGTNLFGVLSNGQIQSDATNSAAYYGAVTNTVAGSYTIPVVRHFIANQGTIGAGSIITTQTGFEAAAALTAGVSNYGFRGQLVAGIENYNLFMNGTAKNYMTGDLGVGSSQNFVSSGPILTTTLTNGGSGYVDSTYTDVASVANSGSGVGALFTVVVSGGIVTSATLTWAGSNYRISDTITISNTLLGGTGSGLVITVATVDSSQLKVANANGGDITLARADASLALNDNIGSIKFENNDTSTKASGLQARISAYGQGAAGGAYLSFFTRSGTAGTSLVEAMRILDNSNVNIVNGRLGIGASSLPNSSVNSSRAITGSTTSIGFVQSGTVQTDVTTTAFGFLNELRTVDAAFTLSTYTHYGTSQASIGASSAITTQIGFNVPSSFTGATNNYGFRGLIGAGTNRWNLYMDGTANNYLAGNLGIGTTTPSYPLQVRRAGGAGSLGISIDSVGSTDRAVQYFAVQDNAAGAGSGHAFYYRAPSSTTDVLGLFLNEGGNVGIGTTSPSYKLQVRNDVLASTSLEPITLGLYNNSDGGSAIYFSNGVGGQSKLSFGVESTGAGTDDTYLGFSTGANATLSERMRITSSGNVGIGTTSPADALHVATSNEYQISWSRTIAGKRWAFGVDNSATYISNRTDNTIPFYLTNGGNVGIGTTNPQATLHLAIASTSNNISEVFRATDNILADFKVLLNRSTTLAGSISVVNTAAGNMSFETSNTERMRITSGGNVGIGTTSPAYKLDVNGTARVSGDLTAGAATFSSSVTAVQGIFFNPAATSNITYIGHSNIGAYLGTAVTGKPLYFETEGAERMRIFSGGNVAIGSSTDNNTGAKLQVTGGMTYQNLFNRRTASYTLTINDQNYIVEMNVGSANNLTIPPNSSAAFPIGTEIAIIQYGAGQTTIVAGSGVTLRSKSNALKISGQYAGCTLVKIGTDEWYVIGDLTL